ncbi:MAG: zf-HC2 domain-containing protein [Maricaulaceae bacterium]|nr:zf-HC2 domain-containing protein [Maricaulaceae bacterium]
MTVTKEMIMSYVDGELSAEERVRVEAAIAADPALAAQVARQKALRGRLSETYDGALAEPVPDRFAALLRKPAQDGASRDGGGVIDFARARERVRGASTGFGLPQVAGLAAAVAVGFAIGAIQPFGGEAPLFDTGPGGLEARGVLAAALDGQISGDAGPRGVAIALSFEDADGVACRAFSTTRAEGLTGVACREADAWRVRIALAAPAAGETDAAGYRMAASALPPALIAAIEDMREGEVLDRDEEAALRARGWRRD